MTNYMKKTAMYKMAKEKMPEVMPAMKWTYYKFYRGHEWLECALNDGRRLKMTATPTYVRFEIYEADVDEITYMCVDHFIVKR